MFISIHFYYVTTTVNSFYKYKASPKDYLGLFNQRLLCFYRSYTDFSSFTVNVKQKNPSIMTLFSIWVGREDSSTFFSMINQSF
jgi:hypothetical protein